MRNPSAFRLASLLACVFAGSTFSIANAADEKTLKEADSQLRDYVHYVKIARYDLAASFGQSVIDKLAKPMGKAEGEAAISLAEFTKLVENSGELARFEDAVARGGRISEIESVSAALTSAYEQGKLESARNPDQIAKAIEMLTGTQRQRLVSRERLAYAGEYAMPQLLAALQRRDNPALQAEVRQLMVDMGRQSARPLQTALIGLDSGSQEVVAGILSEIPYSSSLPYLYEVAMNSSSDSAKSAAMRAISKLGGGADDATLGNKFRTLAEQYYAGNESLTPFPKDSHQLVWKYDSQTGLSSTPVITPVFHETMAMQCAERALAADATSKESLAVWLASNFSRELSSPKDYVNPAYKDKPDAMFYAAAAGTDALQSVLGRALDSKNSALARKTIAALAKTAGPSSVASKGRNPLTEALRFPNRRVQTDAALVLASAAGANTFDGAERVVPVLASAVREAGKKYALVVAADNEKAKMITDTLTGMGYTVLPPALGMADADAAVAQVAGVDLAVTSLPIASTGEFIASARGHAKLAATPVLAYTDSDGLADLSPKWDRDVMVRLIRTGVDKDQTAEAIKQLVNGSTGDSMTPEEAADYQNASLDALSTIGLGASPAYSIVDATGSLVSALGDNKGAVRAKIANVLGRVNDKKAQSALVESAFSAEGDDMLSLVNAATENAKRFGNLLDERQVRQLVDLAGKNISGASGTALSALLGALNVQSDRVIPLILSK